MFWFLKKISLNLNKSTDLNPSTHGQTHILLFNFRTCWKDYVLDLDQSFSCFQEGDSSYARHFVRTLGGITDAASLVFHSLHEKNSQLLHPTLISIPKTRGLNIDSAGSAVALEGP